MPRRCHVLVAFAGLLAAVPALAQGPVVVDGQVGPAFLVKSRSRAIGHGFKPVARIGLRVSPLRRLEVGASVSGVLDSSEHYRVLGGLAHGRLALWHGAVFSVGAGLGIGAGYDADILHGDLMADLPIVPYGFAALDGRWTVGERWPVGLEAGWENLSIKAGTRWL